MGVEGKSMHEWLIFPLVVIILHRDDQSLQCHPRPQSGNYQQERRVA